MEQMYFRYSDENDEYEQTSQPVEYRTRTKVKTKYRTKTKTKHHTKVKEKEVEQRSFFSKVISFIVSVVMIIGLMGVSAAGSFLAYDHYLNNDTYITYFMKEYNEYSKTHTIKDFLR